MKLSQSASVPHLMLPLLMQLLNVFGGESCQTQWTGVFKQLKAALHRQRLIEVVIF